MEITQDQLQGLRKLRLHHYKGFLHVTAHIELAKLRDLEPMNERRRERRQAAHVHNQRIADFQKETVAFLDTFFDPTDTAEKDYGYDTAEKEVSK